MNLELFKQLMTALGESTKAEITKAVSAATTPLQQRMAELETAKAATERRVKTLELASLADAERLRTLEFAVKSDDVRAAYARTDTH